MTKEALKFALLFVVLVVAQVVVFNHLCLFNVAVPLVFVYFIFKLPVTLGVNWVMTLSFLLGLAVDVFSDTLGMNALACTCIGGLRRPVFHLYVPREDDLNNPEPSMHSMGPGAFMKYILTLTALYCILFFFIESFAFFNWPLTLVRIVASTALTFVVMMAVSFIFSTKR